LNGIHGGANVPDRQQVLFAFERPSGAELARYKEGRVPSHRLWGFCEMGALGVGAELCATPDGLFGRLGTQGWRVWQTYWMLRQKNVSAIVSVHEISAVFLLAIRLLGFKGPPILIINFGLLHRKSQSGFRRWIWRKLLPSADAIVSLVKAQSETVSNVFRVPLARCHFVPMPLDAAFFEKVDPLDEKDFVLAVGTNDGKDFETLLEALPLGESLVIVTDGFNAAKIRAHRCFGAGIQVREAVPAVELRELYRQAKLVVIPLADTAHGSGHTVLMENMALGKILIVSASRSMRGYLEDGVNAISVPVGDPRALRKALQSVLAHPERFKAMRERAALDARERFKAEDFARQLLVLRDSVAVARGKQAVRGSGQQAMQNSGSIREVTKHAPIP